MKITAFNPLILSPKAGDAVNLFEELGFEVRHQKEGIEGDVTSVDLKDPNGFRVDVAEVSQMPRDLTAIRINVDDFEEGYELLTGHGFKIVEGGRITDTGSSKSVLLIAPSGFAINLVKHIK